MDIVSISSELSHPDSLKGGFSPKVAALASVEEVESLAEMPWSTPNADVEMADAYDPAVPLLTSFAAQNSVHSQHTQLSDIFPNLKTESFLKMTDEDGDSHYMDTNGKGIFNYLENLPMGIVIAESTVKTLKQISADKADDLVQEMDLDNPVPDTTEPTMDPSLIIINPYKRTASSPVRTKRARDFLKRSRRTTYAKALTVEEATRLAYCHTHAQKGFLSAPAELRDLVYAFELTQPHRISLENVLLPKLYAVSPQVRREAMPIYYAVNRFRACVHMPHTYEEALDPAQHHKAYKCAELCSKQIEHLSQPKFSDFAAKDISLSVLDKDHAHFAGIKISVSKRGVGSVTVSCKEGPEVVAESEKWMCMGIKYERLFIYFY